MANNITVLLYSSDPNVFIDATAYVYSVNSIRGKSRALDYYEPGSVTITFNNQNRVFDPTNTSSPLYGYVKPKQRVVVTLQAFTLFSGLIDDWALNYDLNGTSIATLTASEKTSLFSNMYFVNPVTFPQELSGSRITRVLNSSEVQWPTGWGSQVIDAGTQLLDAQTVDAGTNVFDYIHSIETSEQGQLFIDGTDSLKFQDSSRYLNSSITMPVFADDNSTYISSGSAIPAWKYDSIDVSYSTTLLYNSIQALSFDGVSYAVAQVLDSISSYGKYDLELENVLYSAYERLNSLALFLAAKYSQPEYRFDSLRLNLFALNSYDQATVMNELRLNNFAIVRFKPNSTGSTIEKYVRIIGIEHDATPNSHTVIFRFESIKFASLVLDDPTFGKLDLNTLGL